MLTSPVYTQRGAMRLRHWCCVLALSLSLSTHLQAQDAGSRIQLPALGGGSASIVSAEQERRLGQVWLGLFRNQAPVVDDPLLQDYLEHLLQDLASYSELQDRRLSLIVVDNPTLNAFAVPGGVIGVHNGLILQARHEDELASVLAHELGHLSQRHFARNLELAQQQQIPVLAGLLAGILLAVAAGPDAGMAAITATQAAALQSSLRYSRQHEQEADRIGMQTLEKAGYDTYAVVRMFEVMQRSSRLAGSRPPEFLLTHPLTESRIADARSRASQNGRLMAVPPDDTSDYPLMRARLRVRFAETPSQAVHDAQARLRAGTDDKPDALGYGLALALLRAGQAEQAARTLAPLLAAEPYRLPFVLLQAEIEEARHQRPQAEARLSQALALNPGNYPLTLAYAQLLQDRQRHVEAIDLLRQQSYRRPNDPAIHYRLAELHGLAGQIPELHQSRAEYFLLNGRLDEAERHLKLALNLLQGRHSEREIVRTRLEDVAVMRQILRDLKF